MQYTKHSTQSNDAIIKVFEHTFSDSEGEDEGKLIAVLVNNLLIETNPEDLSVFIALDNSEIVAAVVFSRLMFLEDHVKAFILSPMAVLTSYQGKGVGQNLINYAHEELKNEGVELVVTYGDINFYSKVGYEQISEETIKAPLKLSYPEGWLAQMLNDEELSTVKGETSCVSALAKEEYW